MNYLVILTILILSVNSAHWLNSSTNQKCGKRPNEVHKEYTDEDLKKWKRHSVNPESSAMD